MEIGEIGEIDETNKLKIVREYQINTPLFERVRGSTVFLEVGNELIGVVHFSEETVPRKYFHMLVVLEKHTFRPLRYSEPFVFQHIGVEFCTGFFIEHELDKYVFWVSKMDREPAMISINRDKIVIENHF
jgi:hypothetical protein